MSWEEAVFWVVLVSWSVMGFIGAVSIVQEEDGWPRGRGIFNNIGFFIMSGPVFMFIATCAFAGWLFLALMHKIIGAKFDF